MSDSFDPIAIRELEAYKDKLAAVAAQKKVAADLSMLAIRTLILVNGGSIVGLLTFLGNLLARPSMATAPHGLALAMTPSITAFAFGLGSGIGTAVLGYLAALGFAEAGVPVNVKRAIKAQKWRHRAMALAFLSFLFFALGAALAVCGFIEAVP